VIIRHIEQRVRWRKSGGIPIRCCSKAVIGGFADYCDEAAQFAMRVADGQNWKTQTLP
jgi:hypothetical protein